jgi:hypothetical protein
VQVVATTRAGADVSRATTTSNGRFSVAVPGADVYQLHFGIHAAQPIGFYEHAAIGIPLFVAGANGATDVGDVRWVKEGAHVRGSVTAGGAPVPGALVYEQRGPGQLFGPFVAEPSGHYDLIAGVVEGAANPVALVATPPDRWLPAAASAQVVAWGDARIDIAIAPAAALRGRVTKKNGDPAAGTAVLLVPDGQAWSTMPPAIADADGRYTFDAVPAGAWTVHAVGVGAARARSQITLAGGAAANADLQFSDGVDIALNVMVTLDGKPLPASMATLPLERLLVYLVPEGAADPMPFVAAAVLPYPTSAAGTMITIPGVASGRYVVRLLAGEELPGMPSLQPSRRPWPIGFLPEKWMPLRDPTSGRPIVLAETSLEAPAHTSAELRAAVTSDWIAKILGMSVDVLHQLGSQLPGR